MKFLSNYLNKKITTTKGSKKTTILIFLAKKSSKVTYEQIQQKNDE